MLVAVVENGPFKDFDLAFEFVVADSRERVVAIVAPEGEEYGEEDDEFWRRIVSIGKGEEKGGRDGKKTRAITDVPYTQTVAQPNNRHSSLAKISKSCRFFPQPNL